jgi:hypothetical protein
MAKQRQKERKKCEKEKGRERKRERNIHHSPDENIWKGKTTESLYQ